MSRRDALQGGAVLGLGALLGGGATLGATRSARAAPDADDIGTPSDHVDVYAQNVYDVDGNQYDHFSELGWFEDPSSPFTNVSLDTDYSLTPNNDDAEYQTHITVEIDNRGGGAALFQVDGTTSGYAYESVQTGRQTSEPGWALSGGLHKQALFDIRIQSSKFGRTHYHCGQFWGYNDSVGAVSSIRFPSSYLNNISNFRVWHREETR